MKERGNEKKQIGQKYRVSKKRDREKCLGVVYTGEGEKRGWGIKTEHKNIHSTRYLTL